MFTYYMWDEFVLDDMKYKEVEEVELLNLFTPIFFTPFTFLIDLLLSPLEITTLIVFKILERKKKK